MAFDKGFNFRGTSGYVTDGANETYVLADLYPTTRNGVTFGWDLSPGPIDRNAALDVRLAGMNYNGSAMVFRVDLPNTGTYLITLAIGDAGSNAGDTVTATVKDTNTARITLTLAPPASGAFYDATGTAYSAATWPGSQAPVSVTFATTILNLAFSIPSENWRVAHLFVSEVVAPSFEAAWARNANQ